jgi:hypothetical protein
MINNDAQMRKDKSLRSLEQENIPFLSVLPALYSENDMTYRKPEEIAKRILAILVCCLKVEGGVDDEVEDMIKKYNLNDTLSNQEKDLLTKDKFSPQDQAKFMWRYECIYILLWSLKKVEKLHRPYGIVDGEEMVSLIINEGIDSLLEKSEVRGYNELLDYADLTYRYHWATRNASLKGNKNELKIDNEVIQEWHYAFNWLVNAFDKNWDEVITHT